jgi:hypothetical protein
MRKTLIALCLFVAPTTIISSLGQVPNARDASLEKLKLYSQTQPVVLERGPHEDHIQYLRVGLDEKGNKVAITNSYVAMATGRNFFDPQLNEWRPSNPAFEIVNQHAILRNAQYQAFLPANANDENGFLDLLTPSGERLVTQPIGIAISENDNSKSVFLTEIKDSFGFVDGHTVVYPDAFDGFKASICVRAHPYGIESDIILQERITPQIIRDLGINPETAKLQVWHQVLVKPNATKQSDFVSRSDRFVEENHTIKFGGMAITSGNAFSLGDANAALSDPLLDRAVPVTKEWLHVDPENMDFLIETVPFAQVQAELGKLAEPAQARILPKEKIQKAFALKRSATRTRPISLPALANEKNRSASKAVAAFTPSKNLMLSGYSIDFPVTLISQTNFTFKGNTTYWVDGTVSLYGNTVLEPGSVVKFTNYNTVNIPQIIVYDAFDCRTLPGFPATFTAEDDDTVGEIISTSTGVPDTSGYYALFPLLFNSSIIPFDLHDFQVRYCHVGVASYRVSDLNNVSNGQIYNCYRGLETLQGNLNARNVLLYKTRYAVNTSSTLSNSIIAEHLTVDTAEKLLLTVATNSCYLYITNSIICNVTNDDSAHTYSNYVANVSSSEFKNVGYGYHYLSDSSAHRDAGTTNISAQTQAILRQTTTYAPIILTNYFTTDTALSPISDKDTSSPDLGYHYTPVDFLWSWLQVTNATLTLTNGVSVANYGLLGTILRDGSKFVSTGKADQMNSIFRYEAVQECPTIGWSPTNTSGVCTIYVFAANTDPEIHMRFTRGGFSALPLQNRRLVWNEWGLDVISKLYLQDCQIINPYLYTACLVSGASMDVDYSNNLFENGSLVFAQTNVTYYPFTLNFRNNFMHGGTLDMAYNSTNTVWNVTDNLFDYSNRTTGSFPFNASNNGYHTGLTLGGTSNKTIVTLDFQTGPLGKYYYPTNGTNLNVLINAGSRTADLAALYHYTSSTNQVKETNSTVNIGFHYVASDSSGTPNDSDGDGLADYLEDLNGNGSLDSGETDPGDTDTDNDGVSDYLEWLQGRNQSASALNDTNGIINLRVYTPLK